MPNTERNLWFHGASANLLHIQRREVVIAGAAGTGKSLACMAKLNALCEDTPGLRCLIVRKTRESLTESALVTWEQKVLPEGHESLQGQQRRTRQNYTYSNGSQVILGGMDKPSKIMSTEFDLIYVQEAIELNEEDWEALLTRLRNGRLPYQQLLADTNPDTPSHWIKQRAAANKLLLLESRHEDNPRLYDNAAKRWTPDGLKYLATLDQLTGPRYQRLRHGKWVQAEGAVYDTFSRGVHVVDITPCPPPPDWPRYLGIDFGYRDPFVCLWTAIAPDNRLWVYRQYVRTERLVEDHAKAIKDYMAWEEREQKLRLTRMRRDKIKELGEDRAARWHHESMEAIPGQLRPKAVICDHDAEDRATLQKHLGMPTVAAYKPSIKSGIQEVIARLRVQGDGRPSLYIGAASLPVSERDRGMDGKKLPIGVAEEMEGYVWNVEGGRKRGEEPVDKNNHALDALRYVVNHLDLKPQRKVEVHVL